MYRTIIIIFFLMVCLSDYGSPRGYTNPNSFNSYFITASQKARKSVVSIIMYDKKPGSRGRAAKKIGYASGTILTSTGFIVTNYHVISQGRYFQIIDNNGNSYSIKPFSTKQFFVFDIKTDIALFKVKLKSNDYLQPIAITNSNRLREGEWVLAIGNPYGLKQSISTGIVSSTGRDNIGFTDIEDFIQSDVSINPGNSGGALVNLNGEMVGLNTAIKSKNGSFQGISFSIPSNIVGRVANDLIKYGRVRRGWLGFLARDVGKGVEVISVIKNSPAQGAGLQSRDKILTVDNNKVSSLGYLLKYIGTKPVGDRVNIGILRGNRPLSFSLVLREKNEYRSLQKKMKSLLYLYGFSVSEDIRTETIVVSKTTPISLIFGIRQGDRIVSLNGKKVRSLNHFFSLLGKYKFRIKSAGILRNALFFNIDFSSVSNHNRNR